MSDIQISNQTSDIFANLLKSIMIQTDFSTLEPKKNILIKGAQLHNLKN